MDRKVRPPLPPAKPKPPSPLPSDDIIEEEYEIPQIPLDEYGDDIAGDVYEPINPLPGEDLNLNPPPIWRRPEQKSSSPPPPLPQRQPSRHAARAKNETPPLPLPYRAVSSEESPVPKVSENRSAARKQRQAYDNHLLNKANKKKKGQETAAPDAKPLPVPPPKKKPVSSEHQDVKKPLPVPPGKSKQLPPIPPGKAKVPAGLPPVAGAMLGISGLQLTNDPRFTSKLQERREELYGLTDTGQCGDGLDTQSENYEEIELNGGEEQPMSNGGVRPPLLPPMRQPMQDSVNKLGVGGVRGGRPTSPVVTTTEGFVDEEIEDGSGLPQDYLEFEATPMHVPPFVPKSGSLLRNIEHSLARELKGRQNTLPSPPLPSREPPLSSRESKPQAPHHNAALPPAPNRHASSHASAHTTSSVRQKPSAPKPYMVDADERDIVAPTHWNLGSDVGPPPPGNRMRGENRDDSPPPPIPRREASARVNTATPPPPPVDRGFESPPPLPHRYVQDSDKLRPSSNNAVPVPPRSTSPSPVMGGGRQHGRFSPVPLPVEARDEDDAPPVPQRGASKSAARVAHVPTVSGTLPPSSTLFSIAEVATPPERLTPRSLSANYDPREPDSPKRSKVPLAAPKAKYVANGDLHGKPAFLLKPKPEQASPEKSPPHKTSPPQPAWAKDRQKSASTKDLAPPPWVKQRQARSESPERQPPPPRITAKEPSQDTPSWVKKRSESPERQPPPPVREVKSKEPSQDTPSWVKKRLESPERPTPPAKSREPSQDTPSWKKRSESPEHQPPPRVRETKSKEPSPDTPSWKKKRLESPERQPLPRVKEKPKEPSPGTPSRVKKQPEAPERQPPPWAKEVKSKESSQENPPWVKKKPEKPSQERQTSAPFERNGQPQSTPMPPLKPKPHPSQKSGTKPEPPPPVSRNKPAQLSSDRWGDSEVTKNQQGPPPIGPKLGGSTARKPAILPKQERETESTVGGHWAKSKPPALPPHRR